MYCQLDTMPPIFISYKAVLSSIMHSKVIIGVGDKVKIYICQIEGGGGCILTLVYQSNLLNIYDMKIEVNLLHLCENI